MNKTVIILRACSGAGKSTFATYLSALGYSEGVVICCADDYFENGSGKYIFDVTKLHAAHTTCKVKFAQALNDDKVGIIIVANTNTKEADFKFYLDEATKNSCQVFSLVIENRHGSKDIHNVPIETLEKQKNNIYNSLKLI